MRLNQIGIVHADVKPQNILFVEPPEKSQQQLGIKLIDFGNSFHESFFQEYIQGGWEIGSLGYRAPEVIAHLSDAVGPPIDIWACGVLLAEAALGVSQPDTLWTTESLTETTKETSESTEDMETTMSVPEKALVKRWREVKSSSR